MIKRFIIVFLAVFSLFLFASCANGNIAKESETPDATINSGTVVRDYYETQEEILALIDNETESSDLITQSYDVNLLIGKSYSGSLEEINKLAKIECIRKVDDFVYTIHRVNEGGKFVLFYEFDKKSESWIACGFWWFLKPLHKEDFSKLEIGETTYDDILKIDPTAGIWYFDLGPHSYHILSDYSTITIFYNGDSDAAKVKEIKYGVEPADSKYRKILKIDWQT